MVKFNKPTLTIEDQIKLLESRGLQFANKASANAFLNEIAYYRLSAYFIPFEQSKHLFREGISFEQIVNLYDFDHHLRSKIDAALEKIELFFRSQISNSLALKYGPFIHEDVNNFFYADTHAEWLEAIHKETKRSKEIFIKHFQENYDGFPALPLWMAIEIMSFGSLSKCYTNLKKEPQQEITQSIQIPHVLLKSWLHAFTYVRNICAHHATLWNRSLAIKPAPPKHFSSAWGDIKDDKLALVLLIINFVLTKMPNGERHSKEWKKEIRDLLTTHPDVPCFYENLGFGSEDNFKKLFT